MNLDFVIERRKTVGFEISDRSRSLTGSIILKGSYVNGVLCVPVRVDGCVDIRVRVHARVCVSVPFSVPPLNSRSRDLDRVNPSSGLR